MHVEGFTEEIADVCIRYCLTYLENSVFIWVEANGSDNNGRNKMGNLPTLAASLGISSSGRDQNDMPAGMIILGDMEGGSLSNEWAKKLARRYEMGIFTSIKLGEECQVIAPAIMRRLLSELDKFKAISNNSNLS